MLIEFITLYLYTIQQLIHVTYSCLLKCLKRDGLIGVTYDRANLIIRKVCLELLVLIKQLSLCEHTERSSSIFTDVAHWTNFFCVATLVFKVDLLADTGASD
jgi:hypothetical protein